MTTAVLLAAGQSRRFGPSCKLRSSFRGKPLVRHAADAILASGFPAVAVVADPEVASLLPEFRITYSKGEMSRSLQAGLGEVTTEAALIVLGDMPHVNAELLRRVAKAGGAAAAALGPRICPPALIPRLLFPMVLGLTGDEGAGKLLQSLPNLKRISVSQEFLTDIDYAAELSAT